MGEGDRDVEAEQHLITWVMGLLINALVTQTVKNKHALQVNSLPSEPPGKPTVFQR